MLVYPLADQMMPDYHGGFWHFIRLPDGVQMIPEGDRILVVNSDNGFEQTVNADATGIILTALTIYRRCWAHHACDHARLIRH